MDPRKRKVCVCVCPLIEKSIRVRHAAAALNATPLFAQRKAGASPRTHARLGVSGDGLDVRGGRPDNEDTR